MQPQSLISSNKFIILAHCSPSARYPSLATTNGQNKNDTQSVMLVPILIEASNFRESRKYQQIKCEFIFTMARSFGTRSILWLRTFCRLFVWYQILKVVWHQINTSQFIELFCSHKHIYAKVGSSEGVCVQLPKITRDFPS